MDADDVKKLKHDNARLKKTLKELTIDKNMMEYKLYRAFHKLLNTKKRRIKRLERRVRRLQGNDEDDAMADDDNHCDTCRCRNKRQRLEGAGAQGAVGANEEDGDSDATVDPGSNYGSDTDLDEDRPLNDDPLPLPGANNPSVSVKASSPEPRPSTSKGKTQAGGPKDATDNVTRPAEDKEAKNNDKGASQSQMSTSSSQSTDFEEDLDCVVDALLNK